MNIGSYHFQDSEKSYITAPSTYAYNIGKGDFTIEAWILTLKGGPVLGRKSASKGLSHAGFFLAVRPGSIELVTNSGTGYSQVQTSNMTICDGHWHHVAGVRQGAKGLIYLDEILQPTTTDGNARSPLNVNSTDRLTIGSLDQWSHPNRFFSGVMAEVRLWDQARSGTDISSNMGSRLAPLTSNLIGYWSGEFGVAQDLSPVRNKTSVIGNLLGDGGQPPIPTAQNTARLPFSGIYSTWTQTTPRASWVSSQDLILTTKGFVILGRNIIIDNPSIDGTRVTWPAQPGTPATKLLFSSRSLDQKYWGDQTQTEPLAEGVLTDKSGATTLIRALLKPSQN